MQTQTDAELLDAYSSRQDDTAFGELMNRHGAMVYRACHRMLKDAHEAEDASQAVFVVLARKAGRLRKDDLSAWLYRVAHHVAAETVRKRMHRVRREETYAENEAIQTAGSPSDETFDPAVFGLVDAALLSLPERYRQAVILRYLKNHSQEAAAQLAGCTVGTLKWRASKGIAKLRQRLAKRGVALGGVALAGLLTSEASAAIPETLLPSIMATVKAAAATTATATTATSTAAMLAKGAMKAMFIAKVKMVAAIAAAVVVTGTAVPVGIAVAQAVGKESKLAEAGNNRRTAVAGDYLVIDLSGGPSASNYPVGYLNAVPSGGWTDEYKTTKLVMRKIPAGTFIMGSPTNELERSVDETQHTVTLTKSFYMGVFEVTQRQWELVMGNRPSYYTNRSYYLTRPVEQVSYYDVRENADSNNAISTSWPASGAVGESSFMGKLRAKTGLATFDLPTEAQWEYACRAGTTTSLNSGYNLTNTIRDAHMAAVGRYAVGSASQDCAPSIGTATVGSYLANAWGLYDMHGNVWEWCLDWYRKYPGSAQDPAGAATGSLRVPRGGSFISANYCRSASRFNNEPDGRHSLIGFRVAMTLP